MSSVPLCGGAEDTGAGRGPGCGAARAPRAGWGGQGWPQLPGGAWPGMDTGCQTARQGDVPSWAHRLHRPPWASQRHQGVCRGTARPLVPECACHWGACPPPAPAPNNREGFDPCRWPAWTRPRALRGAHAGGARPSWVSPWRRGPGAHHLLPSLILFPLREPRPPPGPGSWLLAFHSFLPWSGVSEGQRASHP